MNWRHNHQSRILLPNLALKKENHSYPALEVRNAFEIEEPLQSLKRSQSTRQSFGDHTANNKGGLFGRLYRGMRDIFKPTQANCYHEDVIRDDELDLKIQPPISGKGLSSQFISTPSNEPTRYQMKSFVKSGQKGGSTGKMINNQGAHIKVTNINYYENPVSHKRPKAAFITSEDEIMIENEERQQRSKGKHREIKRKHSSREKHPNLKKMIDWTHKLHEKKLQEHLEKGKLGSGFTINKTLWLSSMIAKKVPKPEPIKPKFSKQERKFLPLFCFESEGGKFQYKVKPENWPKNITKKRKERPFEQETDSPGRLSNSRGFNKVIPNAQELVQDHRTETKKMKFKTQDVTTEERFKLSNYGNNTINPQSKLIFLGSFSSSDNGSQEMKNAANQTKSSEIGQFQTISTEAEPGKVNPAETLARSGSMHVEKEKEPTPKILVSTGSQYSPIPSNNHKDVEEIKSGIKFLTVTQISKSSDSNNKSDSGKEIVASPIFNLKSSHLKSKERPNGTNPTRSFQMEGRILFGTEPEKSTEQSSSNQSSLFKEGKGSLGHLQVPQPTLSEENSSTKSSKHSVVSNHETTGSNNKQPAPAKDNNSTAKKSLLHSGTATKENQESVLANEMKLTQPVPMENVNLVAKVENLMERPIIMKENTPHEAPTNISNLVQKKIIEPVVANPILNESIVKTNDLVSELQSNPFLTNTKISITNNPFVFSSENPTNNASANPVKMSLEAICRGGNNAPSSTLFSNTGQNDTKDGLFSGIGVSTLSSQQSNGMTGVNNLFSAMNQNNRSLNTQQPLLDLVRNVNQNSSLQGNSLLQSNPNPQGNLSLPWSNTAANSQMSMGSQNTFGGIGGIGGNNLFSNQPMNGSGNEMQGESVNNFQNSGLGGGMLNSGITNNTLSSLFSNTGGNNGFLGSQNNGLNSILGGNLNMNQSNMGPNLNSSNSLGLPNIGQSNMGQSNNFMQSGNDNQMISSNFGQPLNGNSLAANTLLSGISGSLFSSTNQGTGNLNNNPFLMGSNNMSNGTSQLGNQFGLGQSNTQGNSLGNNQNGNSANLFDAGNGGPSNNAFLQGTTNQRQYRVLKGVKGNAGPRMNDLF